MSASAMGSAAISRSSLPSAGWPAVCDEAADWLAPVLGSLADEVSIAVMREVEEYAQPGDEPTARAVHRVAHDAVAGFGARVTRPAAPPVAGPQQAGSAATMFRDLGRLLAIEGRSLGALQAALRVGARVTWQRLQEQARQGHGDPEAFARIGEAVFWYLDELAASCSAGYAEARAELAGETSLLRRHLLDLLTSGPAPPLPAVAQLAEAVGWPLPSRDRLRQLSDLFGDTLTDPDARFRLQLALRIRRLLDG